MKQRSNLLPNWLYEHRFHLMAVLIVWGGFLTYVFANVVRLDSAGLWFGHENVWSDWSFHVAMTNTFALKPSSEWFAYHPMYAGGQFTYPFLTNLISGLLMRLGASLPVALVLPSLLFSYALLVGMYVLWWKLLRSKTQAVVAISLFFLSSGLGFVGFLRDWIADPALVQWLAPPLQYSRIADHDWLTGNYIVGHLMPQRAFLLGMVLAIWSLVGLVTVLQRPSQPVTKHDRTVLLTSGVLAGILPIAHMHSFMTLAVLGAVLLLALPRHWRVMAWYGAPAGGIGALLYFGFVHGGIENPNFMQLMVGWTAKDPFDWLIQWWRQWGLAIPLGIYGYALLPKHDEFWVTRTMFIGFAVLFGVSNLILFQPITWDNAKFFAWIYFVLSGACAVTLANVWRQRRFKWLAVLGAVLLTFTGAIELMRLSRFDKQTYLATPRATIELGEQIREHTPPRAVFLTATAHNHFVTLWGLRPILMGYPGWVYNFGFNYQQREADVNAMFAGAPDAEALLTQYNVNYVVIGTEERHKHRANEEWFAARYSLEFSAADTNIYRIK